MRGRTNTNLYSGVAINGIIEQYKVADGESIVAGDFVKIRPLFDNSLIYVDTQLETQGVNIIKVNENVIFFVVQLIQSENNFKYGFYNVLTKEVTGAGDFTADVNSIFVKKIEDRKEIIIACVEKHEALNSSGISVEMCFPKIIVLKLDEIEESFTSIYTVYLDYKRENSIAFPRYYALIMDPKVCDIIYLQLENKIIVTISGYISKKANSAYDINLSERGFFYYIYDLKDSNWEYKNRNVSYSNVQNYSSTSSFKNSVAKSLVIDDKIIVMEWWSYFPAVIWNEYDNMPQIEEGIYISELSLKNEKIIHSNTLDVSMGQYAFNLYPFDIVKYLDDKLIFIYQNKIGIYDYVNRAILFSGNLSNVWEGENYSASLLNLFIDGNIIIVVESTSYSVNIYIIEYNNNELLYKEKTVVSNILTAKNFSSQCNCRRFCEKMGDKYYIFCHNRETNEFGAIVFEIDGLLVKGLESEDYVFTTTNYYANGVAKEDGMEGDIIEVYVPYKS